MDIYICVRFRCAFWPRGITGNESQLTVFSTFNDIDFLCEPLPLLYAAPPWTVWCYFTLVKVSAELIYLYRTMYGTFTTCIRMNQTLLTLRSHPYHCLVQLLSQHCYCPHLSALTHTAALFNPCVKSTLHFFSSAVMGGVCMSCHTADTDLMGKHLLCYTQTECPPGVCCTQEWCLQRITSQYLDRKGQNSAV